MKEISRRQFIRRTGAGIAAARALPSLQPSSVRAGSAETALDAAPRTTVTLRVNGEERRLEIEDRWTLAEVLRDQLDLTGTKIGCDRGECGACTVLLEGKPIYSCSYLAVWADGKELRTVEGLAAADRLDPLQEAFMENDGPQCGFCTSGQLMSARALLDLNSRPTTEEVRQALAGNLCRCSNYNRYLESVLAAAEKAVRRG
jgi:aerobic-type carbon monoxide dehydrogenase small subunit (CoxS/CutS family)